ncbi:hypothetical protein EDB89DRAFT_2199783, partial [Lactarius sanguifluus]
VVVTVVEGLSLWLSSVVVVVEPVDFVVVAVVVIGRGCRGRWLWLLWSLVVVMVITVVVVVIVQIKPQQTKPEITEQCRKGGGSWACTIVATSGLRSCLPLPAVATIVMTMARWWRMRTPFTGVIHQVNSGSGVAGVVPIRMVPAPIDHNDAVNKTGKETHGDNPCKGKQNEREDDQKPPN